MLPCSIDEDNVGWLKCVMDEQFFCFCVFSFDSGAFLDSHGPTTTHDLACTLAQGTALSSQLE